MKKLVVLTLVLTLVLSLAACSAKPAASADPNASASTNSSTSEAEKPADPGKTWDVSISGQVNTTDTIGKNTDAMAEGMSEATNGVVTAHFFGGGTLGAQRDVFNALTTGEIEMAVDGSIPVDLYAPEYGFLVAPFMIRSMDHLKNIIASPVWDGFEQKLEENGIMILGVMLRGSRQTISSKPIDWNNTSSIIIRMPDVATYITAWTAAGANTQVMGGGDVYGALQNGVVNAAEGPWSQHVAMSLADICKYGYETNHMHEFYAIYASKTWFDALPAETQEQLKNYVADMCEKTSEECLAESDSSREQLEQAGVTIETPDVTKLFDAASSAWEEKFASGEWTSSLDEILSYNK